MYRILLVMLALAAPSAVRAQAAEGAEDRLIVLQSPPPAPPEPDLRPLRLSVSLAATNALLLGLSSGGAFMISNDDRYSSTDQRSARIAGGLYLSIAVADLGWMIYSAIALSARKGLREGPLELTPSRVGTGFMTVNSALWLSQVVVSFFVFDEDRALAAANLAFSGVLLGFHLWGLVANIKELRTRKRLGREATVARTRLQAIPGGFRF